MSKTKVAPVVVGGRMDKVLHGKWCDALLSGRYDFIINKMSDPSNGRLRDMLGVLIECIDPSKIGAGDISSWWAETGLSQISPQVVLFNDQQLPRIQASDKPRFASEWVKTNIPIAA